MNEKITTNNTTVSGTQQHALFLVPVRVRAGEKAQIALEYITITAFMLIVTGILFGFALLMFNESTGLAQADAAVAEIADQANWVASLGDGSKVYFEVTLPNNVQSLELGNKQVRMVYATSVGNSEVYTYAKPNLTPVTISVANQRKTLSATFIDGNVVVGEVA